MDVPIYMQGILTHTELCMSISALYLHTSSDTGILKVILLEASCRKLAIQLF
jgi:hypothetical protein